MGTETKIQWCDHTFNPWRGCTKVSAGCANCYAEVNYSVKMHGVKWGPNGTRVRLSDAGWREPLKWNREAAAAGVRKRVFCASLADIFESWPLIEWNEFAEGYRVSIYGKIQSRWRPGGYLTDEWRDISPRVGKGGYFYFDVKGTAGRGTVKVHRIVLEAFVGPTPKDRRYVRHLDGNPANNQLWNLIYGTQKENQEDMRRHGTSRVGAKNGRSKLSPEQVEEIIAACGSGESQESVGRKYGVGQAAVSKIVRGVSWNEPELLSPFDGIRHHSLGHVVGHQGRPLFHAQRGYSDAPKEIPIESWRPVTLDDLRCDLFALIDATPHLDWLLLTKRPENIRRMWPAFSQVPIVSMHQEQWRPIPGHDPYFASSHGRIRGPRGIVAGDTNETGHRRVTLHGSGGRHREQVYRLVLLAFVGPPPSPDHQCRHLDGDATNNCLENLSWGTQSENWSDSKRHGTHRRYSKLTEIEVADIRSRYANGETFADIASNVPVSATQVANVCRGQQWSTLPRRSNCWLGTSIENQEAADQRIPELLQCRDLAPVLFLSAEPLLGPIDLIRTLSMAAGDETWIDAHEWGGDCELCGGEGFREYNDAPDEWGEDCPSRVNHLIPCRGCAELEREKRAWVVRHEFASRLWLIAGGESGPKARPCDVAWIRSIVGQCEKTGVPCFVKQDFGLRPGMQGRLSDELWSAKEFPQCHTKTQK